MIFTACRNQNARVSLAALLLTITASAADAIRFEPYEYTYRGRTIQAELGRFIVPERHDKPNGPRLTLAFVRLRSTSLHSGFPIIYLAGGPGGSGIDLMKGPRGQAFLAMREAGDVIALDH